MLRAKGDRQQGSKQRQGFLGVFCGRRKRGFEFCELLICAVLMLYAGGSDQLADHRIKRTVLVIGRAVVDQSRMSLCGQPLLQRKRETRLADAGLAGYQHDLPLAALGARPTAQQRLNLLFTADERRGCRTHSLYTTPDDTLPEDVPVACRWADAREIP